MGKNHLFERRFAILAPNFPNFRKLGTQRGSHGQIFEEKGLL